MPKRDYAAFRALDPFFAVVMEGLSKFVDGEHYFDTLADDVLFEFLYEFPGWPRVTRGRDNLISLYSGTVRTSVSNGATRCSCTLPITAAS
jgi:hypothetical protein